MTSGEVLKYRKGFYADYESGLSGSSRFYLTAPPAEVSASAKNKARRKRRADGLPVHSLRTLLGDLATVAKNRVVPKIPGSDAFDTITRPTKLQRQALALLEVRL